MYITLIQQNLRKERCTFELGPENKWDYGLVISASC